MIEVLKQQFSPEMPDNEKLNRAREFLQLVCLKIMYDKGAFINLAFTGGTALRVIFGLRRFSEDLDFSLVEKKGYSFTELNTELLRGFSLNGFTVESKPKDKKNVHSTMLKFSGLLKEVGLLAMKNQKLSIKIEVDTNPPKGGHTVSTLVNKIYALNITHFDLPSLFATKLHACFYRKYLKGRDFYDFIWYLGKRVKPNILLLNNAITQTQGKSPNIDDSNFKEYLLKNIEKIDFNQAKNDVEKFLEDKSELVLFNKKAICDTIDVAYT